jgi:hypothetical protein
MHIYIHRCLTLIDYARSTPLGQYVRLITLVSHLWVNTFYWLRSFLTFESIRSIDYACFQPLCQYVSIDYVRFSPLGQYVRLITLVSHLWVNTFWLITLVSHLWVNTFDRLRSFLTFGSKRSIGYARFTPLSQYVRLITLVSHLWVNTFWLITLVSHLWVNTFDRLRSFLTFGSIRSIGYVRFTPLSQYVRLITLVSNLWVNTFWLITLVSHLWANTFDWLHSFHTFGSIRSIDYARFSPLGQFVRLVTLVSHLWVNTFDWLRSFHTFGLIRSD